MKQVALRQHQPNIPSQNPTDARKAHHMMIARAQNARKKVQERFLDPFICYLIDKIYPYFLVSSTVVFILLFLMIMILFLLLRK